MQNREPDRNRRVLVIDDNPAIHDDFRKILVGNEGSAELADAAAAFFGEPTEQATEFRVELDTAAQGEEGVKKAAQAVAAGRPFAMAFVDMRMPPGWDGLRTITELWKIDPCIQVVICSAHSDQSWSQIRQTLGETDQLLILKKPFDNAEVLQLAMALIEKRHLSSVAQMKADRLESLVAERTKDLHKAKEESERLISAIDSILIGLNAAGEIQRWNPRAVELFGLDLDQVLGKPFVNLPIEWADKPAFVEHLNAKASRCEVMFDDATGSRKVVGLSTYPIADGEQSFGTLVLGSDLTENRLLANQLHQAQKLESVGQLAAGVAHEINTPMQYIGDNLDFLEKKVASLSPVMQELQQLADDDSVASSTAQELVVAAKNVKAKKFMKMTSEAIADARDGVRHVSKIVRAMKEFAHPGQEEMSPVDINRAIESTIAVSTNEWKYVATIETDFDPAIPNVCGLSVELNQVFLNILVNAAHAVGDANEANGVELGTISISTSLVADHVQIAITDSGTGIPDDVKERIFDPFFTTKEVGKGTGQGLSIAHGVIVGTHNGRLWCESSPGKGTTFFIQIPAETRGEEDIESYEAATKIPNAV